MRFEKAGSAETGCERQFLDWSRSFFSILRTPAPKVSCRKLWTVPPDPARSFLIYVSGGSVKQGYDRTRPTLVWILSCALVVLTLIATPVWGTNRFYTFEEPDWSVGDAMSDFKFSTQDDTTGVIDVVALSGAPSMGPASAPVFPPGGGGTQALLFSTMVWPEASWPGPTTTAWATTFE